MSFRKMMLLIAICCLTVSCANTKMTTCCQTYPDDTACRSGHCSTSECAWCKPCDNYHVCIDHVDQYSCENY